jgi:hypothetical protein
VNPLAPALEALGAGDSIRASIALKRHLAIEPADPDGLNLLGMTELDFDSGGFPAALGRSLATLPDDPDFLRNLGLAGLRRDRLAVASLGLRRALTLMPTHAETHLDLGNLAARYSNYVEAERRYDRAVLLSPDHVGARQNRGWARLALGDLARGFQDYAWRWRRPTFSALRTGLSSRPWDGQRIDGTLLLYAEQGFGDTLQFCRLALLATCQARRTILEVQAELATLLRRSLPDIEVVPRSPSFPAGPRPHHDVHAALLDLPTLVGLDLDSIPAVTPYLAPDPAKTTVWAARIAARSAGRHRIGLVWAGSARAEDRAAAEVDRRRSLPITSLAPLASVRNAVFYSLQLGRPAEAAPLPLVDLTPHLTDFDETAAAIANLDLVVTVDTAVAHLAGALGRPVWVLSRADHCWRWLTDRTDSPWYPTLRLFRQRRPGDWAPTIAEVVEALTASAVRRSAD